jgi:hypothetical protein
MRRADSAGRQGATRGKATRRFVPAVEILEDRVTPTSFTMTSPTHAGELPPGVTQVGGVVLDLIGANGRRVVSELPASSLFRGFFNAGSPAAFQGNPGTIGIQTGFTPAILTALGGGLAEVGVRLTVFDGDTAPGNFDFGDNELLLNGLAIGNFSNVVTQETSQDGLTAVSSNPAGGFRNDKLDTGFFHSTDPAFLAAFVGTLGSTGEVTYQLQDVDPFDNFFDFTQGVASGLVDVGQPPTVANLPPRISSITNDGPIQEGRAVHLIVTATDPDGIGQPLTYEFDFDNDGTFETSNNTGIAQATFPHEGTFVVAVRVIDADGGVSTGFTTVEVDKLPPRHQTVPNPSRVHAGSSAAPLVVQLAPVTEVPVATGTEPQPTLTPARVDTVAVPSPPPQPSTASAQLLVNLSGGGGAALDEAPPSAAPLFRGAVLSGAQVAASVRTGAAWVGRQLVSATFRLLDQISSTWQALAARAAPGPAVVVGLPPGRAPPVQTTTAAKRPAGKPTKPGSAIQTTVLVLAAILIYRRWSNRGVGLPRFRRRQMKAPPSDREE